MRISGVSGEIRIAGRVAAALSAWTIEGVGTERTFSGTMANADPFWIATASPFELRLSVGKALWLFREVSITVSGDRVTAPIGLGPEVSA